MPPAIMLPILVGASAATSIYGAKRASDASKRAAELQTRSVDRSIDAQREATREALAFQKQMYERGQQQMAPYLQMGRQSLGTLGRMMGFVPGEGQAPVMVGSGQTPAAARSGPPGRTMGNLTAGTGFKNPSLYQGPNLVRMVAPTGEEKSVPSAMVPHFIARGARVVQ